MEKRGSQASIEELEESRLQPPYPLQDMRLIYAGSEPLYDGGVQLKKLWKDSPDKFLKAYRDAEKEWRGMMDDREKKAGVAGDEGTEKGLALIEELIRGRVDAATSKVSV
jgi:hypothetical protein